MTIGERIKSIRENKGMEQQELAERVGISKQLMYKYEAGAVKKIPSDKIEAISDALNVSPWEIMGWNPDRKNGQIGFYTDADTVELLKNPNFAMILDASKGLTADQLKQMASFANFLRTSNDHN